MPLHQPLNALVINSYAFLVLVPGCYPPVSPKGMFWFYLFYPPYNFKVLEVSFCPLNNPYLSIGIITAPRYPLGTGGTLIVYPASLSIFTASILFPIASLFF